MKSEIPAVTKLYDIILWLIPQVEKFPRDYKFTLGDRIIKNLLDGLETIIEAVYTKDKTRLPSGTTTSGFVLCFRQSRMGQQRPFS